jgi:ABC-type transport system substrate-binding protein
MQLDWTYPSGFSPNGPLVDQLVYFVYPIQDQEVALMQLQAGQLHAYDSSISNSSVYELSFNSEIEVNSELSSVYRQFTLNCQVFPTNITAYRRALAYALDKFRVVTKSTGGLAEPLDTPIPLSNPFYACEQDMQEHFYYFEPDKANDSLQAANFIDTPDSPHPGWRYFDADMSGNWTLGDKRGDVLAPEGVKTEVIVIAGNWPSTAAGVELVKGMWSCGLQADLTEVMSGMFSFGFWKTHGNIICFTRSLPAPGEPYHLYDVFHSDGFDNTAFHYYSNPQYDYNVTMMMQAPTLPEARGWAINCCRILIEDMPMIVCYNEIHNHAYRTDLWEGFVDMVGVNRFGDNPWTLRKVHIKETLGGPWAPIQNPMNPNIEYYVALTEGMWSTNVLEYPPDDETQRVMNQIYSRLWQLDPYTWDPVPDLAWNWSIEPTTASGDIQDGQKFAF